MPSKLLDKTSIRNFLSLRYNPEEIPHFKPASWRNFETKFYDPDGYKTERLLKKSVSNSLAGKNDIIVVSLSAGIDSTLSLALLRESFPDKKIIAICAIFKQGFNEAVKAKIIAKKFDADFKIVVIDSIFTRIPELVSITGKPKWNTYHHLIAKEAKKFGKILVTGDGADEIFGGYTFRYNKFLKLLQPKDNWVKKTTNYLECHNRDWVPDQQYVFGGLIKFNWNKIYNYFKPYFINPLHPLQQVMLADFNGKLLFDFIPTGQAISRHYDLQQVSIFIDQNLINFALHLPLSQKYDHKNLEGKIILRKIAKRFGIEQMKEKKGFSPDLLSDWKKYGKKICESYLLEKNSYIFKKNLINYNWVLRAFERVENENDIRYLNRLVAVLTLEIWYRIFISKDLSPQLFKII